MFALANEKQLDTIRNKNEAKNSTILCVYICFNKKTPIRCVLFFDSTPPSDAFRSFPSVPSGFTICGMMDSSPKVHLRSKASPIILIKFKKQKKSLDPTILIILGLCFWWFWCTFNTPLGAVPKSAKLFHQGTWGECHDVPPRPTSQSLAFVWATIERPKGPRARKPSGFLAINTWIGHHKGAIHVINTWFPLHEGAIILCSVEEANNMKINLSCFPSKSLLTTLRFVNDFLVFAWITSAIKCPCTRQENPKLAKWLLTKARLVDDPLLPIYSLYYCNCRTSKTQTPYNFRTSNRKALLPSPWKPAFVSTDKANITPGACKWALLRALNALTAVATCGLATWQNISYFWIWKHLDSLIHSMNLPFFGMSRPRRQ